MYKTAKIRKNAKNRLEMPYQKAKRVVLNFKQKEDIINQIKAKGFSYDKVALVNNLSVSTVYKIVKKENKLVQFRINNPNSLIRKTFKLSPYPEMEKALLTCEKKSYVVAVRLEPWD
jgi:hypothetical protein